MRTHARTRTRTHPHAYPRAHTRVHAHAHTRAHITHNSYTGFEKTQRVESLLNASRKQ